VTSERALILIVDDEPFNVDYLEQELEDLNCDTVSAANGLQALERVAARSPDLILLDIMMPEMDGFQVLSELRAHPVWRHIPVVIISALHELHSVVKGIEMGADEYLPKPFEPVLLKARISACLERKAWRDREVLYLRQIEEQKRRADELLHVILPAVVVDELKTTGKVEPRAYEDIAVLYADVVGFTPYCDRHAPDQVLDNLQSLMGSFEQLTLDHDLQKIRTAGDAFLAVGGMLKPLDNPTLHCVRCGLDMVAVAATVPAAWHVRVGIHTGPLMAGIIGHRQYLFDVWGDTVNTAQRMQSYGLPDAVNLSQQAWQQVAPHCRGESLGLVDVKGKGGLEIFRVVSVAEADSLR